MLNLSFVKTFVTLIEAGSFIEAARRLGLAQPTISQQVRKLEESMGAVLVRRDNTGCVPTPQGRTLLPYARSLLAAADRFKAAVSGDRIRIGCSGNIATYYISAALKDFVDSEAEPIHWEIRTATNPEIARELREGSIDLAALEWPDDAAGIDLESWRREPLVVIVAPDHALADKKALSIDQMLALNHIGGESGSGTGTVLREALGPKADTLRVTHSLQSTEAVKNAVRAGLGSSIVLEAAVADEVAAGHLVALPIDGLVLEKAFCLAVSAGLPEDALPKRMMKFLAGNGRHAA